MRIAALAERLLAVLPESCDRACDPEIRRHGQLVLVIAGPRASVIETWVRALEEDSGIRVDWGFVGGRALVISLAVGHERSHLLGRARHLIGALEWVERLAEDERDEPSGYPLSVGWA